ncbi:hypothetical protein TNCV_4274781 [Trichonephila clavipes]|nr:hypothetical protein TNCV_4274781 [Trichonephila clavipes]
MTPVELRWQKKALEALQECTEFYLMSLLQKAQLCAFHIGRATIMKRDLQLARRGAGRLRGRLEHKSVNSSVTQNLKERYSSEELDTLAIHTMIL